MPEPLPITAVNHVAVTTRRVAESTAFYRDVLGFWPVARPAFDFNGAWLFNYGLMIHIIENQRSPGAEGEISTRDNYLALHSDDLGRTERLLREHEIPYRKNEIKDRGIKQLFFRDPDGYHIEVGTYPPTPPFLEGAGDRSPEVGGRASGA
jgi:catechol 2,3-dioxygenase-like lactoylglutathione lyase family enzyme